MLIYHALSFWFNWSIVRSGTPYEQGCSGDERFLVILLGTQVKTNGPWVRPTHVTILRPRKAEPKGSYSSEANDRPSQTSPHQPLVYTLRNRAKRNG